MGGSIKAEKRYVISSTAREPSPVTCGKHPQGDRERPVWVPDVTVGEDASSICLRNSAHNFSFLRRTALNLFRTDKFRAISLPRKLKTAAYNPAHLVTALHLREI